MKRAERTHCGGRVYYQPQGQGYRMARLGMDFAAD